MIPLHLQKDKVTTGFIQMSANVTPIRWGCELHHESQKTFSKFSMAALQVKTNATASLFKI